VSATPDLLRTIWTRPRATVRWVLAHGDRGLWPWLLTGALATAWTAFVLPPVLRLARDLPGPAWREPFALLLAALPLLSFGAGFAALLIAGRVVCGRFAAHATLRALAWGLVPLAAALPFALLLAAPRLGLPGIAAVIGLAGLAVAAAWAFALVAAAVAEVHEIPTTYGIGLALAAGAVVLSGTILAIYGWVAAVVPVD
jgi:hypothetical protein